MDKFINNFIIKCIDTFNNSTVLTELTALIYNTDLEGIWYVYHLDQLVSTLYAVKKIDSFSDIIFWEIYDYSEYCFINKKLDDVIKYDWLNVSYDDKQKIISKHSQQYFSLLKTRNEITIKKANYISKLIGKATIDIFLREGNVFNYE